MLENSRRENGGMIFHAQPNPCQHQIRGACHRGQRTDCPRWEDHCLGIAGGIE